jgi:hypothetical protein
METVFGKERPKGLIFPQQTQPSSRGKRKKKSKKKSKKKKLPK